MFIVIVYIGRCYAISCIIANNLFHFICDKCKATMVDVAVT